MTKLFKIEKLDFLISFYITCVVLSEVMGAKTFPLLNLWGFHLNATVAIFILPLLYSINDMVIEVYGKERAQSIVRSSLAIILFILLFSILATSLPPSARFLPTESAYDTIFGKAIRFSAASLIAFIISEFADIYIFSKLRELLGKTKL